MSCLLKMALHKTFYLVTANEYWLRVDVNIHYLAGDGVRATYTSKHLYAEVPGRKVS